MVLLLGHESLKLLKLRPDAVFDGLQAYMNRGRIGIGRVKGGRETHPGFHPQGETWQLGTGCRLTFHVRLSR